MALMLDETDIMGRFDCPQDAIVFLLGCMAKLGDECVDRGDRTRLLMAFDLLSTVRTKVYE